MPISLSGNVHPNPGPVTDQGDISICHINIRSLKAPNRMAHIRCDIAPNFDIITLSETWLSKNNVDENYLLSGFQTPFRRDRVLGTEDYGGVLETQPLVRDEGT